MQEDAEEQRPDDAHRGEPASRSRHPEAP
jgi:hypothetical protein